MRIKRDFYLSKLISRMGNGQVKVVTGVRRCGKSYLLNILFYEYLISNGVPDDHIIRFAFDSADDLEMIGEDIVDLKNKMVDPRKFMKYIKSKYIDRDFEEQHVPRKFEEVCRQYLIRQNKAGKIDPVIEKIGKYYYDAPKNKTNGEFDVVTLDENGYVFYEVKFRKKSISKAMIDEEIEQVKLTGLNCYKYVFFARSGFQAEETEDIKLIQLKELYKA